MQVISRGTADFEKIRCNNAIYVDKTEYLWNLICNKSNSQYFLTRPRRFGKSLTISTLKAIFQGRKELFEGLAISTHEYSWEKYPIIHLDFSDYENNSASPISVKNYLIRCVRKIAPKNGVAFEEEYANPGEYFSDLILQMSVEKPVVVLIDEYDKIITENIDHPEIVEIRNVLAGFYSVLKKYESNIRFLFMTGVTKFSQVSIFSKLNSLTDISRNPYFATMLGYTQGELESYFAGFLKQAAENNETSLDLIREKIKLWYDGFLFEEKSERVYNPVSIGSFFSGGFKFSNYWFSTGTPSFLFRVMEKRDAKLEDIVCEPIPEVVFDSFDVESISPKVLFLQSGYLTIDHAETDDTYTKYFLRFPNHEVKSAFMTHFLNRYQRNENSSSYCDQARKATREMNVPAMIDALNRFLEDIPYEIRDRHEKYYQSMFYAFFSLANIQTDVECHTSRGRIDAVMVSKDKCFVCEFKVDKSAEIAMKQIKERDYCKKYVNQGYKVIAIAANFDSKRGLISDVQYEPVS